MSDRKGVAVIIGAGPAGLTAASELLDRTGVRPIVLEALDQPGGLARTVRYRGNRIDLGGHRFFSKSDRVMSWWARVLPLQRLGGTGVHVHYQGRSHHVEAPPEAPDPQGTDRVMLVRSRRSRILFLRQLFNYPLRLNAQTLRKLGPRRVARMAASYLGAVCFPYRPARNLEEFFINRFGRELYRTFFQSYTEKVWGVPCRQISAEWGQQRIKGLSIGKSVAQWLSRPWRRRGDVAQKSTETSLIEHFLYPKLGPGQMWEEVAAGVAARGGEIIYAQEVTGVEWEAGRVTAVLARDRKTGSQRRLPCDWCFSTMAVRELIEGMSPAPPPEVREVARGLVYRDFITVGLLLARMKVEDARAPGGRIQDNWIYIQEPGVRVGRIQVFNNWSPWLVARADTTWLGLEYFCDHGDDLWVRSDAEMVALATAELQAIGFAAAADVLDGTVIRAAQAYPAYWGTYTRFDELRRWVDGLENLFLIGRNGMHKYDNQDHAMLTAMVAVDNIVSGRRDKANIWEVNTEQEYHEEKPRG